ncbi:MULTISPECIES: MotA/TolQ/ExbB proton channel family protein [unclassified Coleofasciculus]|uniref:MotA/TolQ/ExbB proton channel family protein n=1 Tax=unclassified Coleofasciculus TaxID=2692782 RepID=UPI001880AF31|nr:MULTISPECIES: MotA/TolQ/ExbB proton channel family protein [unclassified Coleofasciculus]MBE9126130.1 MotA/TolQ/ExbB proton channel family protein [Coleofasciculus sp. LEGE 07081]MBE9147516.1 MotA/TolQ/ExbB proton channel family protein [Coleofasciculus sp. LEGE 07092]
MPISAFFSLGGVVMLPLLALSLLAIALILERANFWMRITERQQRLVRDVIRLYEQNPPEAFLKLEKNSDLPIARIFLAALELQSPTPEKFRLALETATQAELPVLKRFNTAFETIISVSPLLGLLGTILGLINAFSALRIGDIGGQVTQGVTGGISEALITTVAGLCVAIFTLVFANTFRGLYRRQLAMIQEYGGKLELLYWSYYERTSGSWRK